MLNTFDLLKFDYSTVKNLRYGFHIMLYILIGIFYEFFIRERIHER